MNAHDVRDDVGVQTTTTRRHRNLVIGGIVSVLPLSILLFVPEQSVTHYAAHVVYAVGQIPLLALGYRALRRPAAADDSVRASVRVP